jgi:hypothetical protein
MISYKGKHEIHEINSASIPLLSTNNFTCTGKGMKPGLLGEKPAAFLKAGLRLS